MTENHPFRDRCPNCLETENKTIYEVSGVPAHSVLLMPTRESAVGYPKGDVSLAYCRRCGFIWNRLFDPLVHEYSANYEETQGFSATFNTFAKKLAGGWVERYDLEGKTVLEIGCGKGEFLLRMCEMGGCKGIGIDPAYVPGRLEIPDGVEIEFIRDFYSDKHSRLEADFICCRHTLEHIQDVRGFVGSIRRAIGDRLDTVVCFDLPDMLRVLEESAFWDIYYEHCSYFGMEALRRLFEDCGFEVRDLRREYDNQYLVIETVPRSPEADGGTRPSSLEDYEAVVDRFVAEWPRRQEEWKRTITTWNEEGRTVVLWGGGSKGVAFLTTLGLNSEVRCVVDINPYKNGLFMPGSGHRVVLPQGLQGENVAVAVLMNAVYWKEVRKRLDDLGLAVELATA